MKQTLREQYKQYKKAEQQLKEDINNLANTLYDVRYAPRTNTIDVYKHLAPTDNKVTRYAIFDMDSLSLLEKNGKITEDLLSDINLNVVTKINGTYNKQLKQLLKSEHPKVTKLDGHYHFNSLVKDNK